MLQGLAGTGKSTIALTMCEAISKLGWLGASFFCSRNEASSSNPFLIFTTIAYQLATRYQSFNSHLTATLKADPDVVGLTLEKQLEKLVIEPLCAAADSIGSSPVVIIIDALDECGNYRAQMMSLLCSIGSRLQELPICVKLFVTLRPEYDLKAAFTSENHGDTQSFILHDVEASIVHSDIERFLHFGLLKVAAQHHVDPRVWPSTDDISILAKKSDKLFIFAATVVKFVGDKHGHPRDRLDIVLKTGQDGGSSPYSHLDHLYQQVLESALPETADKMVLDHFHMVMGAVILLYDPLSIENLGSLVHIEAQDVRMALQNLHSLMIVPDSNNEGEIRLFHPSFRDFMTLRCPKESAYHIDTGKHHQQLAMVCFKTMAHSLKKDICRIRDTGKLNKEVMDLDGHIKEFVPVNLQYACRHWATHLSESVMAEKSGETTVIDALMSFASLHLLHWIEVLSLIGCLDEGLPALQHAFNWASVSDCTIL